MWRRYRLTGGYGNAVRRAPARPDQHFHDDERAGTDYLGHVPRGGRKTGRPNGTPSRGRYRTIFSRNTSHKRHISSRPGLP